MWASHLIHVCSVDHNIFILNFKLRIRIHRLSVKKCPKQVVDYYIIYFCCINVYYSKTITFTTLNSVNFVNVSFILVF